MIHIPVLRQGKPYKSVDVNRAYHYRTREQIAEISQANVGLIRRDLLQQAEMHAILQGFTTRELIAIAKKAAKHFGEDELPLGDSMQTPDDIVKQISATTGSPNVMVRRNMEKVRGVLDSMETVLSGLTRLPDLDMLDRGYGDIGGRALSFFPRGHSMGVILPSNSPGVHSLWAPAIALKTPLILKPGSSEPWTPYRIVQAYIKAGIPREVFGYYSADHAGGGEILRQCGRGMLFGDVGAAKAWAGDPRIEIHGPGYSKIVLADEGAKNWEKYLDLMADSIAQNSGRSCVNCSSIWTTANAREIAEALAERFAKIGPRAEEDPEAAVAPFAAPDVARRISLMIDQEMEGTADLVEAKRGTPRVAEKDGCTYLLPAVVQCSKEHALANREFLFPYASVVQVDASEIPHCLGPTLVCTAITSDKALQRRLLESNHIGRLNFGPISTMKISWDQPHEGNLFDHLYSRRAFQSVLETVA
ncbi:MAG: aldehyde dehydrogenase [Acidobacteria bacterium]|nr:aldehyde dehydrogenase [Acidobacteriota bacterium]